MPRYFFHVYDDVIAQDQEGIELPNVAAARLMALVGARDLIAEQVRRGYFVLSHWIDVVGDQGDPVLTLTFRDAVELREE
ncbi:MAG TPA: hypothetical protein VIA98_06960 [Allosphingosinicella sp.]